MSEPLPSDEYEEVVELLMRRIASQTAVRTDRLERPAERIRGEATTHQIDVLWDFTDGQKRPWRLLFEARSYRRAIEQQAVFAFDGVVQDIGAVSGRRCVGVMVTHTGYQTGAQQVADTKDVLLLELRQPTNRDTAGRVMQISVVVTARIPVLENVRVELETARDGSFPTMGGSFTVRYPNGDERNLVDVLVEGELSPLDRPPTTIHEVRRIFESGTSLIDVDGPIGTVRAVVADVGDSDAPPVEFTVGGFDEIVWLLKNTLTGVRMWFARNGRQWVTES